MDKFSSISAIKDAICLSKNAKYIEITEKRI